MAGHRCTVDLYSQMVAVPVVVLYFMANGYYLVISFYVICECTWLLFGDVGLGS